MARNSATTGSASIEIDGNLLHVRGPEATLGDTRVVIDKRYGRAVETIRDELDHTLSQMRRVLRRPIREVLVPRERPPIWAPGPACSRADTGQVCIWQPLTGIEGDMPGVGDLRMLEHEGAHLLYDGGPPDLAEWNDARVKDKCLWIDEHRLMRYPPHQWVNEDWARAVEGLSSSARSGDSTFENDIAARADIVMRELGDAWLREQSESS